MKKSCGPEKAPTGAYVANVLLSDARGSSPERRYLRLRHPGYVVCIEKCEWLYLSELRSAVLFAVRVR